MKCKACNGKGYCTWCVYESAEVGFVDKDYECAVCHGTGHIEQTNDEWRRTCSTEEFAEFIIGERKGCVYADCPNGETPCMSCKDGCDIDKVIEWLKQPHTEKE